MGSQQSVNQSLRGTRASRSYESHQINAIESPNKRKRAVSDEDNWDFFVSVDENRENAGGKSNENFDKNSTRQSHLDLPTPETHPPVYILEATLEDQELWYKTAGQRPVQPPEERKYYESLWKNNFEKSEAFRSYSTDLAELAVDKSTNSRSDTEVLFRGKGPFSYAVSKSFLNCTPSSMTLQIPRFEIRASKYGKSHAEYLVVVSFDRLTFGIWRRYSAFYSFLKQILELNKSERYKNEYHNTILSWECLRHRQRYFRCLDKDYVALKCFLLERFLHDCLFESHSPSLLLDFLGLA